MTPVSSSDSTTTGDVTTSHMDALREKLTQCGQEHVLDYAAELGDVQRAELLSQIQSIDLANLSQLIEKHVLKPSNSEIPSDLEPASYYPTAESGTYDATSFTKAGHELIKARKVAAFTVAGGQGTRLGWRGPKGTYPATVVTGKPLFRCFAEQILATERKYGVTIPWYIMTSPVNDADTRAFFQDNNCFGLNRRNIFMFPQGMMPSLDAHTGRILLAEKHEIAMNPDGHGGSIKALHESGATEDMRSRGIEQISYFQIDNPLVRAIDPLFLGLHATAPDSSGQMSSKMVAKAYPEEKVGVFCTSGGKTMVIEYSDLPDALSKERDEHGTIRFIAGSIAIHAMSVAFVEQLTASDDGFALPFHRAVKKVPHIDMTSGTKTAPDDPNGVKLETFVFDAIPLADSSIVLETRREDEFAPIKNADGVDSPATSHQLQSDQAGAWLEANGVTVPRRDDGHVDAKIEISPLTAMCAADLASAEVPTSIERGAEIVL